MNSFDKKIDSINEKLRLLRKNIFHYIIILLDKLGFSGNSLSLIKIFFGILYLITIKINFDLALILLIIGLMTDLFDGPLARYQKQDSDRGKFVDMLTDSVIFSIFIWGLIILDKYNNQILSYNLIILPLAYLMVIVDKNENEKTDWIIKPMARISYYKLLIELILLLNLFFNLSTYLFNKLFVAINILLSIHFLYRFLLFVSRKNK